MSELLPEPDSLSAGAPTSVSDGGVMIVQSSRINVSSLSMSPSTRFENASARLSWSLSGSRPRLLRSWSRLLRAELLLTSALKLLELSVGDGIVAEDRLLELDESVTDADPVTEPGPAPENVSDPDQPSLCSPSRTGDAGS